CILRRGVDERRSNWGESGSGNPKPIENGRIADKMPSGSEAAMPRENEQKEMRSRDNITFAHNVSVRKSCIEMTLTPLYQRKRTDIYKGNPGPFPLVPLSANRVKTTPGDTRQYGRRH